MKRWAAYVLIYILVVDASLDSRSRVAECALYSGKSKASILKGELPLIKNILSVSF